MEGKDRVLRKQGQLRDIGGTRQSVTQTGTREGLEKGQANGDTREVATQTGIRH